MSKNYEIFKPNQCFTSRNIYSIRFFMLLVLVLVKLRTRPWWVLVNRNWNFTSIDLDISPTTKIIFMVLYSAHKFQIVKLRSLFSQTEWSNISERNSNLIVNLKKGTRADSTIQMHHPPTHPHITLQSNQ